MVDTDLLSHFDLEIAARTLYGEFRGEPNEAKHAGAHVLANRFKLKRGGDTLAQVCLAHAQFSCWLQTDPNYKIITGSEIENDPLYPSLLTLMGNVFYEPDPTNGATSYYALSMKTPPYWVTTPEAVFCGQFGNSKFYKGI